MELEIREPPVRELIADEVKALWDEGLKYTEIAERVGWNRNIVADALTYWHESRGLPAPSCPRTARHFLGGVPYGYRRDGWR